MKGIAMSDDELRTAVEAELLYEPRIDNDRQIAVAVHDGIVTLRGTVGSLRERFEANKAAKRVTGVMNVDDQLQVRILGSKSKNDAELRGDVLQALMLDSDVPPSVDAKAVAGSVTLSGTATHRFQTEEAVKTAAKIEGVTAVDDQIMLVPAPPTEHDIRKTIEKALKRTAKHEAERISVVTSDGVVSLHGKVNSWAERDAVVSAASRASGVKRVDDYIAIES
jgi:osmotically-inducible protein OsmY